MLSFGYWCTDFLVVQRAMAADSMSAARRTPVLAAFPKMMMPFIVIVPGIVALSLAKMDVGYALPMKWGWPDYDQVLTTLMAQFYPAGMLGVGLTALMASFMSGMAGNVTAFNTVFTYDIYQSYIRKNAPDAALPDGGPPHHDLRHAAFDRHRLSGPPLQQHHGPAAARLRLRERAAVRDVPAGHVLEAATGHGAFLGLLAGTAAAAATHGLTVAEQKGGWIAEVASFPSTMAQNFWIAIFAWSF